MMFSIKTIFTVIFLLFSLSLNVQAKTENKTVEVGTQTVTTEDGRKVILKSDGTWEYANKNLFEKKGESTLSLDTGIIFRSGDIKPVARTEFYLLDKGLVDALLEKGYSYNNKKVTDPYLIYIQFLSSAEYYNSTDDSRERFDLIWSILRPHVIQSVTTNFDGKAIFKEIPPGQYYLMGLTKIGQNSIIWNVEVNLSPGDNSFTLDQNNAAYITTR